MATRRLRSVTTTDKPSTPRKRTTKAAVMNVQQAADKGSRRELLVAMQTRVARAIDDPNTPARDLAALTRRQLEIARDIEAIDLASGKKDSVVAGTNNESWEQSAI